MEDKVCAWVLIHSTLDRMDYHDNQIFWSRPPYDKLLTPYSSSYSWNLPICRMTNCPLAGEVGGNTPPQWSHCTCMYIGGPEKFNTSTINSSCKTEDILRVCWPPRRGSSEFGARSSKPRTCQNEREVYSSYNCRYGYIHAYIYIYMQKMIDRLLLWIQIVLYLFLWGDCRSSAERSCGSGGSFFRRWWLFEFLTPCIPFFVMLVAWKWSSVVR
jgi:hypothetical protein